jgi:8-oxo-dGTP pyrophosphatase MutT (NUDIX family)
MEIIYAKEPFPEKVKKTIFLAGPTPRPNSHSWKNDALKNSSWKNDVINQNRSWRELALKQLQDFDGHVFVPEPRDGKWSGEYDDQVEWEEEGLNRADAIIFWVPRNMETLPALTTNIEWGMWYKSGKVFYGRPNNAAHIRYLDYYAQKFKIKINETLDDIIKETVNYLGEGAERNDGDASVPLYIWKNTTFQKWLESQKAAGNTLTDARVKFTFPEIRNPFLFSVHAKVWIGNENREKVNEVLVGRSDVSHVVLYHNGDEDKLNTEIVLVKEFRTPSRTEDGLIHETPGGSSKKDLPIEDVALKEVEEEVGLTISPDRLVTIKSRQVCGTLSCHSAHVFSVKLTDEEMLQVKSTANDIKGVFSDSERTYREIKTIKELLSTNTVDWSNMGMILSSIL